MDALQAARRIYDSTFRNLADKELTVDVEQALVIATFCATLAQAEQLKRIADALENLSGAYTTATFGAMPQDNPE